VHSVYGLWVSWDDVRGEKVRRGRRLGERGKEEGGGGGRGAGEEGGGREGERREEVRGGRWVREGREGKMMVESRKREEGKDEKEREGEGGWGGAGRDHRKFEHVGGEGGEVVEEGEGWGVGLCTRI